MIWGERKRIILLIVIMSSIAIGATGVTIWSLYRAAFSEEQIRLRETATSQARLMEAIARFDAVYSVSDVPGGPVAATLRQIEDAHGHMRYFGKSFDFALARREGDRIVFLLSQTDKGLRVPAPVSMNSNLAEPMRRAVRGESGTMVGLNYEGERVLAAYEPVSELNLGIVAAVDVSEIRAPFVKAGLLAGGISFALMLFGTITFLKIANPLVRNLEANERKYRVIFEQASDGIYLIDSESSRILDCNRRASLMDGYSVEELKNMKILDLYPPEEHSAVLDRLSNIRAHGQNESITGVHHLRKDGKLVPIELNERMVEVGGQRYYLGIVRDVTGRLQVEEERRKIEEQIRQAQKLESIGVLAGGIAHDFNNLLVGVLGYADLTLLALPAESPVLPYVNSIKTASIRLSELTKQLLAYSGKGKFLVERLNLSKIVEEMAHLLEVSIHKKVVLKYDLEPRLPPIEVDATQLRQVIMNLITNAAEAIDNRSGVITLRTGVLDADPKYLSETFLNDRLPAGYYVFLEVSDTGCGMDKQTLSKIFDPFFSTKFTGRGLGLAAVMGIVRGHRGAIRVYSEQGRGSTFKLLFPCAGDVTDSVIQQVEKSELIKCCGTILVVDDDETVRTVARMILEKMGCTVLTAIDGRNALEVFRKQSSTISAVILDLTMPHMDGIEAFGELRRIDPGIPIIMTSGYNEQDATSSLAGKGLSGFIQKPFDVQAFMKLVLEVMQKT